MSIMINTIQKRMASNRSLQKWAYELSGFNKYGLLRDDLLDETTEDVSAALKRLPRDVMEQRNFRILRATQLSIQKEILPKSQWTKFEEDVLYLTPLVEEIAKEKEEKKQWGKKF